MSSTLNMDDLSTTDLSLICRGCLATVGEMKNMVEWGMLDEFYKLTNVQVNTSDSPSQLLCARCEDVIHKCRSFRLTCQEADRLLKSAVQKRQSNEQAWTIASATKPSNPLENTIHTELTDNQLKIKIVAPDMNTKIYLPCLYCDSNFLKRTDLVYHLIKQHRVTEGFSVDLKYYCHMEGCVYRVDSCKGKCFNGRKYLNQHIYKVHREKINCAACKLSFFNEVDYKRHVNTCNNIYVCQICEKPFKTYEIYLVHLLRKHPDLHKQYKNERRAEKRASDARSDAKKSRIETHKVSDETDKSELKTTENQSFRIDAKKVKNDKNKTYCEKIELFCHSPKRSFATQTLNYEEHIKNDVTLPPWQAERSDDTKKDETSTQTVFEDLLSLKSNMSEDYAMFSDSVSLSDIQTQTLPLEFGLSRSNKETITSETQSPDLSIKETQTCLCLYESPKPNLRCAESVSSSPSTFNMLTSTETQTLEFRGSFYNDLLSFSSAETQTCFEDDSDKEL